MEPWKLDAAYEATQRSTPNGGLLVVRHGYLLFEKYFGRASCNANPDMASTGKGIHQHRLRHHAGGVQGQDPARLGHQGVH